MSDTKRVRPSGKYTSSLSSRLYNRLGLSENLKSKMMRKRVHLWYTGVSTKIAFFIRSVRSYHSYINHKKKEKT